MTSKAPGRGPAAKKPQPPPAVAGAVLEGLIIGLLTALLLSLFVGVLALIRGSAWNPTYQVSTWLVIAGYLAGGALAGALAALLRQFMPGRLGAVLVGLVVGPFAVSPLAMIALNLPPTHPPVVITGLLLGGLIGWQARFDSR